MADKKLSEAERRWSWEQVLASGRLSGDEPTPEFLADIEAHIKGELTSEQLRRKSILRALNGDAAKLPRVETCQQLMDRFAWRFGSSRGRPDSAGG